VRGDMDGGTAAWDELDALAGQLTGRLAGLGSALIAFSAGGLLPGRGPGARALGDQALAVTAVSPALASGELDGARSVAAAVGVRHELISTAELDREDYRRNDRFRCYYCKSELYDGWPRWPGGADSPPCCPAPTPTTRATGGPGCARRRARCPASLLEASVGKDQVRALAQH